MIQTVTISVKLLFWAWSIYIILNCLLICNSRLINQRYSLQVLSTSSEKLILLLCSSNARSTLSNFLSGDCRFFIGVKYVGPSARSTLDDRYVVTICKPLVANVELRKHGGAHSTRGGDADKKTEALFVLIMIRRIRRRRKANKHNYSA